MNSKKLFNLSLLFSAIRLLSSVLCLQHCVPALKIDKFCDSSDQAKFLREAFVARATSNQEFYCNLRIRDRSNPQATSTGTSPTAPTLSFTTEPIPLFNFAFRPAGQSTMPIIADTIWTPALTTDSATYTANVKYRVGSIKFNLTTNDPSNVVTLNGTIISNLQNIPNQTLNVGANTFTFIATNSAGTTTKNFTINRASQFVFITTDNGSINRFRLNESNNTLEPLSAVSSGFVNNLKAFAIDAFGDYLLVGPDVVADNKFKVFKINFMTGDLTGLNNNNTYTAGFAAAGGLFAEGDKTGRAIYLTGNNDSIQPIFINRQNDTISLGNIVTGLGGGPRDMQISPDSNSILVAIFAGGVNDLFYYSVNSDGNLTSQATYSSGAGNMGTMAFHPDGTKLFIAGRGAKRFGARSLTSPFAITGLTNTSAPGGTPTNNICSSGSIFPYGTVYSNNGQFVIYACEEDRRIYSIGINQANGDGTSVITNLNRTTPAINIVGLDMDLSNRYFVSVRSGTATSSVELNSISPTGALAFIQSYNSTGNPVALRSVRFLY